eukprot:CAMPEP_0181253196 /NCGR_PEP_ID=MMETSP1096-20121128/47886_1 /TAXON_ID=156174 ORGANISM="Chrysochromulina ericina, Strain CCMP281" /NCGR_SAMPLE_ID=MMETSP1096 /ASSEMBLY_ACC=CAM_ASM_000453 /LENGTH=110 /DNA_ID=CAMNT_0023351039 /DNA_START=561 /DNA_END=893 /DNA_ORIENTATION=+
MANCHILSFPPDLLRIEPAQVSMTIEKFVCSAQTGREALAKCVHPHVEVTGEHSHKCARPAPQVLQPHHPVACRAVCNVRDVVKQRSRLATFVVHSRLPRASPQGGWHAT